MRWEGIGKSIEDKDVFLFAYVVVASKKAKNAPPLPHPPDVSSISDATRPLSSFYTFPTYSPRGQECTRSSIVSVPREDVLRRVADKRESRQYARNADVRLKGTRNFETVDKNARDLDYSRIRKHLR